MTVLNSTSTSTFNTSNEGIVFSDASNVESDTATASSGYGYDNDHMHNAINGISNISNIDRTMEPLEDLQMIDMQGTQPSQPSQPSQTMRTPRSQMPPPAAQPPGQESGDESEQEDDDAAQGSFHWNDELTETMIDALLAAQAAGQYEGANFKPQAWAEAVRAVQQKSVHTVQRRQLENRYQLQKRKWKLWRRFLAATSGWTRDPVTGIVTHVPSVTMPFFAAHKEFRIFRNRALKHEKKLDKLFEENITTGEDRESVHHIVQNLQQYPNIQASPQTPTLTPCSRKRRRVQADIEEDDKSFKHQVDTVMESLHETLSRSLALEENKAPLSNPRRPFVSMPFLRLREDAAAAFLAAQSDEEEDEIMKKGSFLHFLKQYGVISADERKEEMRKLMYT
ncbi:hypothetical protein KEM55_002861 [Ascosphaera atra]|nr:hypothetical protein KEM55_002861 [Ascosphaera atra]